MNIPNSERLTFRLMDENDAELLWQLDQNPEVMRHITHGKISSMDNILSHFIPRLNSYHNADKGWGLWQVSTLALQDEPQEFLGWILIRPMNFFSDSPELNNLEIGWRFFQHTWGKGYATEAAKAIIQALTQVFSQKGNIQKGNIDFFSATAFANNHASISIMKKLGMDLRKEYNHQDSFGTHPSVYYQMQVK